MGPHLRDSKGTAHNRESWEAYQRVWGERSNITVRTPSTASIREGLAIES